MLPMMMKGRYAAVSDKAVIFFYTLQCSQAIINGTCDKVLHPVYFDLKMLVFIYTNLFLDLLLNGLVLYNMV